VTQTRVNQAGTECVENVGLRVPKVDVRALPCLWDQAAGMGVGSKSGGNGSRPPGQGPSPFTKTRPPAKWDRSAGYASERRDPGVIVEIIQQRGGWHCMPAATTAGGPPESGHHRAAPRAAPCRKATLSPKAPLRSCEERARGFLAEVSARRGFVYGGCRCPELGTGGETAGDRRSAELDGWASAGESLASHEHPAIPQPPGVQAVEIHCAGLGGVRPRFFDRPRILCAECKSTRGKNGGVRRWNAFGPRRSGSV